jgi:hypothetical protein
MNMNKFKSILIFFILISIFTIFKASNSEAYTEPSCTVTGGKVVAPGVDLFCVTETDVVKVIIREVGLCKSLPSAPTTSEKFNNGLGADGKECSRVYYDPTGAGETVSISKDSTIALEDAYTLIPNTGTYTYGYVITSNILTISFVKEFTNSISSTGTTLTSGTWCGTKNNVSRLDSNSKYINGTICGTESIVRAASGEREEVIYSLCEIGVACQDSGGGLGTFSTTINFTNVNNTGRSLDVYLTNIGDGKLPTAVSPFERDLLWFQQLQNPITTTGDDIITIAFDKSSVATIENDGGTPNLYFLTGGPVELIISATSGEVF